MQIGSKNRSYVPLLFVYCSYWESDDDPCIELNSQQSSEHMKFTEVSFCWKYSSTWVYKPMYVCVCVCMCVFVCIHTLHLEFSWIGAGMCVERERERERELFHFMTCHLRKVTYVLVNIWFETWKIGGLPRCSMQMYKYILGWSHHIDAGYVAESKDLCFDDWDSKHPAVSAVLLTSTWHHPVKIQPVLLLNIYYQFCVEHVG